MATPISTVPARARPNPPEERSSVPASTVTSDASTTREVPEPPEQHRHHGRQQREAEHRDAGEQPDAGGGQAEGRADVVDHGRQRRDRCAQVQRVEQDRGEQEAPRARNGRSSRRVERGDDLAQQRGELVAVALVEVAEQAALDVEQVGERGVDPGEAGRR